jgi:protocatechuate 3,4-dioxygenase beta subunit
MRRFAMRGRSSVCVSVIVAALVAADARELVGQAESAGRVRSEAPLGMPAVFSGKIVGSDGRPVAGAKVTLYEPRGSEPPYETRVLAETTSADDGTYRLALAGGDGMEGDGPTYGTVVVQKEGLSLGWASWRDPHLDRQWDIALMEPKDLAGTVVDGRGRPVEGATVFAVGGQYEKPRSQAEPAEYLYTGVARRLLTATTDAAGRFFVRGLPAAGRFELAAQKAGYGPAYTWTAERPPERGLLLVPGRTDIRMVLGSEARIEGKVVEKASGRPIGGVEIAAWCWRTNRLLWPAPVRSHDDGAFALAGLSPDEYVLQLAEPREPPADWVAAPVTCAVEAGEVKRDVRLELGKGSMVEVVVSDVGESTPVPGAEVWVQSLSGRGVVRQGVTNAEGVALLRLMPGEYRFQRLAKRGYTYIRPQDSFTVEEGRTRRVAWPVRPLPAVSGVVLDEAGRPLAGTVVRVQPTGVDVVFSDTQGRFRVTWDTHNWSAETVPYLVAVDRQRELAAALPVVEDGNQVELMLHPAATFFGQVVDINDRGIPGAEITIMLWGPTWGSRLFRNDTIRTDAQGRFEIRTVPSEHKYQITAVADGYGRTDIDMEPNEVTSGRVEVGTLHLAVADRAVSGLVVDEQGRPVPDARIYTVAGAETGQRDCSTRTDGEGRFRLEGLRAGWVRLQAAARLEGANLYANLQTEAGASDARIVLERRD